ncbi:MAG: LptF/LptG family permease [Bacteroidales bacterium]|nr:LptF/LptG family permease [Candidatus Sodaliphilus limicaballi]
MLRIKKLYVFMLKTFIPLFAMTFFICLFIVMMQFLWKYIDDLVGKGLSIDVIAELFFYAALSMVPLALPLSILLASLMTFGNLGEHVELTAMKSSGISLTKVMAPLFALMVAVSIGAFFFQNDVLPRSQVKMWTLMFSMRQKTPTLDIPEGTVYTQIPGYNLYVKKKGVNNDMLYGMLIYDVSNGSGYPRIVAADSGRLSFTDDKRHLVLNLYHGNWYEDMHSGSSSQMGQQLYRRETFKEKEIMIRYDDNFTRMDEDAMASQYIGKNISELRFTIDSLNAHVDTVARAIGEDLRSMPVCGVPARKFAKKNGKDTRIVNKVHVEKQMNFDSIFNALTPSARTMLVQQAMSSAMNQKQDYEFRGFSLSDDQFIIRRHEIEMQKKFTLSLACIIFFLIGAPLGAIIRKGGLGTPIVISIILFIIYYIIDNMGYKLAREGRWVVWEGMWLSSAILMPLGIFLTRKAVNDSAVFNPDAWRNFLRKATGLHQVRKLTIKEVIINEVEHTIALEKIAALRVSCQAFLDKYPKRQSFVEYWRYGFDKKQLREISSELDELVDYLSNSRDLMVINKAMDFPIIRQLLTYRPAAIPALGVVLAALLPLSVPFYLIGLRHQKNLKRELQDTCKVCDQLTAIIKGEYTREMEYNPTGA